MDRYLILICTAIAATPAAVLLLLTILIGSGSGIREDIQSLAELIVQSISATAALGTAVIAWKALSTWKEQEIGVRRLDNEERIIRILDNVKSDLNLFRMKIEHHNQFVSIWHPKNETDMSKKMDRVNSLADKNEEEVRRILFEAQTIHRSPENPRHPLIKLDQKTLEKIKILENKIIEIYVKTGTNRISYSSDANEYKPNDNLSKIIIKTISFIDEILNNLVKD